MEHFVSLQMWAVLVAAPCVIAWFLGDLNGAARMRRMIEAGEWDDLVDQQSPVADKRSGAPIPPMPRSDTHPPRERPEKVDKVWDEPDSDDSVCLRNPISERVLQHYRGSISELGRRNALSTADTDRPMGKEHPSPGAAHTGM